MCKAMSPSLNIKNNKKFKTKIMSKTKTNNVFSTATIYDKYNAEAAQKRTGYMFEWSFDKEKTLKVSSFLQKLNDDYGVPKKAFANSTSKCKITKCFCKSTPLVLRISISFLVSH